MATLPLKNSPVSPAISQNDMLKILAEFQQLRNTVISRTGEIGAEFRQVLSELAEIRKLLWQPVRFVKIPEAEKPAEKTPSVKIQENAPCWNKNIASIITEAISQTGALENPESLETAIFCAWDNIGAKKITVLKPAELAKLTEHAISVIFSPAEKPAENVPVIAKPAEIVLAAEKRGRGRPPGSSNKKSAENTTVTPAPAETKPASTPDSAILLKNLLRDLHVDSVKLSAKIDEIVKQRDNLTSDVLTENHEKLADWAKAYFAEEFELSKYPAIETNKLFGFIATFFRARLGIK